MPLARINGTDLSYAVDGDRGDPVLHVAGSGQSSVVWEMQTVPALLAAGYRTVVFDNRGMPPSAVPPAPYTVEDLVGDTVGLMEHLDLGPFHMIGSSLGGLVTQAVALRRPDLIRSVTFLQGCGDLSPAAVPVLEATAELYALDAPPPAALRWLAADGLVPPTRWHDARAVAEARELTAEIIAGPAGAGVVGQTAATLEWAAEDHLTELADLSVPALVVASEWDRMFPPALLRRAVETIPDARYLEIDGAAHVPTGHSATIAAAVLDFLKEIGEPSAD
ncbi:MULTISPECIES: alpha/beta fold hydrolase [Streptomyces]|uniref:alpha/beta fold hydrolase n=1 Tax=Streptomyces TaxID=1883 RepID=UPI000FFE89F3|nr:MULTISPECIES: alpha/beta hydrolase [Streptomyces]WSI88829.1 alpha/beta hydrolase [Streptomyces murinus]